jgi:hypothetical protein
MTGSGFCNGWTYLNGALSLNIILGWVNFLGETAAIRAGDVEAAALFAANAANSGGLYASLPLRDAFPERLARMLPGKIVIRFRDVFMPIDRAGYLGKSMRQKNQRLAWRALHCCPISGIQR